MPSGPGTYGSKRGRPKGSKNKPKSGMKKQTSSDKTNEKQGMEIKGLKDKMKKSTSKKGSSSAKGKVFTAKNGRKYIKMANGRTRFIKG